MIEMDSMQFIVAIAFTTAMIMLVVGMYGYHLVVSGNRLRKAQRFAEAAVEFTPAYMTIVFDEHDRVAVFKTRNPASEKFFREAFAGRKIQELSFLPDALRSSASAPAEESAEVTAPLKLPDGSILYLKWEMQNFTNNDNTAEFRFARAYDITTELLQKQKKLQALSATSSEDEERQRKRIAEDLHDRIGEILITSARLLDDLKKKNSSPEISKGLDELDRSIEQFTRGTRSLIADLVPPVLYNVGFVAAVEAFATDFARQHNVVVRVEDAWQDFQVNQEIAIFLYKAVREFLHNAIKHGGADEIVISLSRAEQTIAVTVQDNGSGFTVEDSQLTLNTDSGFGLFNVKNRAEYYGGGVAIGVSADLAGGQIKVWVPEV